VGFLASIKVTNGVSELGAKLAVVFKTAVFFKVVRFTGQKYKLNAIK
jgi:hypothetical protein